MTKGGGAMADEHPRPGRGRATVVEQRPAPLRTDDGDHERFAHYIFVLGRNAEAVVLEARVTGTPVKALCGKRWVPQRDPRRFPVCPTCKEILARARGGGGDNLPG
jgi:hypothetical protein